MEMKQHNRELGFTLVELIVVVAIIGLLASVLMAGLDEAREKGRDARRLADMEQIQVALELYRDSFGEYPGTTASYGESDCSGWDSTVSDGDGDGRFFIDPLSETGMMSDVPIDPQNDSCYSGGSYRYYRYAAGTQGCDASKGRFYVLGIIDLEGFDSADRPNPDSPGFDCLDTGGRDWRTGFDWVTGAYEY